MLIKLIKLIKQLFFSHIAAKSTNIKGQRPSGHNDATSVGNYYPY